MTGTMNLIGSEVGNGISIKLLSITSAPPYVGYEDRVGRGALLARRPAYAAALWTGTGLGTTWTRSP